MNEYVIRYRKPGDEERVRRSTDGGKRKFTWGEAQLFLGRNRVNYPNARIVKLKKKAKS